MNEFKVGDTVYCPSKTNRIHKLLDWDDSHYTLGIRDNSFLMSFTQHGVAGIYSDMPSIFHATPENHELLTKLYGVEFEVPPKHKTPKEVIQAMLNDGWRAVTCLVNDHEPNINSSNSFPKLISRVTNTFWVIHEEINWVNAQPIDLKTFKKIIDYVDGKVILEE